MSTRTEEMGSAGQANEHATINKRGALDDEIEFISSNPVKKRRLTEQKHAQGAQGPMKSPPPPSPPLATLPALAPSPPPTTSPSLATSLPPTQPPPSSPPSPQTALIAKPTTPPPTQTLTADRRRSMCDANQVKASVLNSTLGTRGKSLPVLEKFVFPQSLAPVETRPRQRSEAISPKQLPQAYQAPPEASANINHFFPPTPGPSSENSVTLDQISCLDFNGTPTNTPGFDVGQVFSMDGGIMGSVGFGNAVNLMQGPTPFNPTNTPHNLVPFMTHSAGNVMTMPQGENSLALSIAELQNHNHTKERFFQRHPTAGNTVPRQPSPTSAPKAKPPCPHCVQSRLATSPAPVGYMPTHHPASHQLNYHTPPAPVNNHSPMPRPAPAHPAPTSRPPQRLTSININNNANNNNQRQHSNHHNSNHHNNQHHNNQRQHNHNHQTHQPIPSPSMTPHTMANPTKSPNSSNFLQDIAQTIQSSFPYAQVAARHGMAPATVAEVLASLVVVPLLLRGGGNSGGGTGGGTGGGGGRLPPRGG